MKRFLYVLLAVSTLLFLSCGKNGGNAGSSDSNEPSGPEETVVEPLVHPEGSVENDIVYAYVNAGEYSKFGMASFFTKSDVVKATADAHNWRGDKPAGIRVSWKGSGEFTVSISTPEGLWYEEQVSDTTYTFSDLIPGVHYTWSVSAAGNPVKNGEFTPTGNVRMVKVPCSWNYRDIGGWPGLNGKRIRYGWVYRGGSLNGKFVGVNGKPSLDPYDYTKYEVPDSMCTAISRIGIKAELDLRGDLDDLGLWGDEYDAHGATLRRCQFDGVDFMQIMTDMGQYHTLYRSSLVKDVAWIIGEVRSGKPVAFHCRSGADRTGALAILLEGLLGVGESDVQKDYELTTLSTEKMSRSTRYASKVIKGEADFFTRDKGIFSVEGETLHEKCYRYLNAHFSDVRINADDLDWFIKFMLGTENFTRPSWARNYEGNSLDVVYNINDGSASHFWTGEDEAQTAE